MTHQSPQQGFSIFWVLPLLLAIGTSSWLISRNSSLLQPSEAVTEQSLMTAKMALLGYAASYPEIRQKDTANRLAYVYGHLPCPSLDNTNNAGQEAPQCGKQGVSVLGRLPWTTLGLPPLMDASGECLWYAISGNYKANPKADLLNPDVPGQLVVQTLGNRGALTLADDVIAVVFAPGKPQPGQARTLVGKNTCTSDLIPENFLDAFPGGSNASLSPDPEGISYFMQAFTVQATPEPPNDRLVWITRQELFSVLEKRPLLKSGTAFFDPTYLTAPSNTKPALAQRVANCLREFALKGSVLANSQYGRLPWAAPLKLSSAAPNTFKNDRFNDQKNLLAGRIPMLLWDTKQALASTALLGTIAQCASSTDTDCRLFRTNNCTDLLPIAGYPTASDSSTHKDSPDGWLEKWKDHLFYAVAPAFQPATGYANTCQSSNCLQVNGRPYAAIVLYAGSTLVGQTRLTNADKQNVANYLENQNATSVASNGRIFGAAGNDQMVCLRPDLSLSIGCTD
ncbi:MAG: hypothetical protein RIR18_2344 [Pseudomonadota bacterium]|jgi:hypothetical protein